MADACKVILYFFKYSLPIKAAIAVRLQNFPKSFPVDVLKTAYVNKNDLLFPSRQSFRYIRNSTPSQPVSTGFYPMDDAIGFIAYPRA